MITYIICVVSLTVLALQERDDLDVPCILNYDSLFNLFWPDPNDLVIGVQTSYTVGYLLSDWFCD